MQIITSVLSGLLIIPGVVVLIKLFQREGVVKGILGFICMIYTFMWGWMHAREENIQVLMIIWTVIILGSVFMLAILTAFGPPAGSTRSVIFVC